MVGMSLYILADTYFIANGVGRLGLAALNIGLPAYNLIFGIGALLGIGGGTVFSILHGRGELGRANRPFTISAVLGTAFSLLFALLGLVAAEPIAFLLGATEETALYTTTYLRVILLFSPAFILNNIMTAFCAQRWQPASCHGCHDDLHADEYRSRLCMHLSAEARHVRCSACKRALAACWDFLSS